METIIILANLGQLKGYRIVETPTRGRKLERVEEMVFPEAHGRFSNRLTDQLGRFSILGGVGPAKSTQQSDYETLPALAETERRLTRLLAEKIAGILHRERTEQWYFAAAPEIHDAVLEEIEPALRERLKRNVRADLVKTPPGELLARFGPWAS